MPSVLSLKKAKESSTLKDQIRHLEEEKEELQRQLEQQKKLEAKLREDLLSQKKDFEHLEKQFDHFAGVEAEFEALQTEVQLERLETLVNKEKEEARYKAQVKKAREEQREIQDELKELKKLDPQRLKRQVVDLKKKSAGQAAENKTVNSALVVARKELKEVTVERDRLQAELKAAREQRDFFWQSNNGTWKLFESHLTLDGETQDQDNNDSKEGTARRVRCLNSETGVSVVSQGSTEDDKALWPGQQEIPDDVSLEAGKRLKKLAAEHANTDAPA